MSIIFIRIPIIFNLQSVCYHAAERSTKSGSRPSPPPPLSQFSKTFLLHTQLRIVCIWTRSFLVENNKENLNIGHDCQNPPTPECVHCETVHSLTGPTSTSSLSTFSMSKYEQRWQLKLFGHKSVILLKMPKLLNCPNHYVCSEFMASHYLFNRFLWNRNGPGLKAHFQDGSLQLLSFFQKTMLNSTTSQPNKSFFKMWISSLVFWKHWVALHLMAMVRKEKGFIEMHLSCCCCCCSMISPHLMHIQQFLLPPWTVEAWRRRTIKVTTLPCHELSCIVRNLDEITFVPNS